MSANFYSIQFYDQKKNTYGASHTGVILEFGRGGEIYIINVDL